MGFGKDGRGTILYDRKEFALGALAAQDVIAASGGYTNLIEDGFRIIKGEFYIIYNAGAVSDAVVVGIASGELDASQIEEAIEARPTNSSDVPEAERTMRPVWPLAEFHAANGPVNKTVFKTLRWSFNDSSAWSYWAYNPYEAAGLVDGGTVTIFAKLYGVWVA